MDPKFLAMFPKRPIVFMEDGQDVNNFEKEKKTGLDKGQK